jgi:hypothetical protein
VFETLIGLDATMVPGPGVRLAVAGAVSGRPAQVLFDVTRPMTLVTTACFDRPLVSPTRVKLVDALGDEEVVAVTPLLGLSVAGRRLRPREAGLVQNSTCVVVLGMDGLTNTALEVDVSRRLLRFVESQTKEAWMSKARALGGETQVLDVTKDARFDWPLIPVRLFQADATLTGTFVLSTKDRVSQVLEAPVQQSGFTYGPELLKRLTLPRGFEPPSFNPLVVERVELAPGVSTGSASMVLTPGALRHGVVGSLAADVWGRFEAIIDVPSGVLLLHRPLVLSDGARAQCGRGEEAPSDAACFELSGEKSAAGLVVTASVWRPLPQGGRLYLDFPGLAPTCRMGFTFDAGERGRSTQHVLPWPRLFETMHSCAESVAGANTATLGLFEDTPLKECPGVCAFAQDFRNGRVNCECQPGLLGFSSDTERQLLERIREVAQPRRVREAEPLDPD